GSLAERFDRVQVSRWSPGGWLRLSATRLAENLPRIDSLTLSPDVLTGLLSRLGRPAPETGA
ncbi:hypothetical protein ACWC1D_37615, partial [Streptomyces sp. NPDC001478]